MLPLKLTYDVDYAHHRSGWRYALKALSPLFQKEGLLFDSHVESTFCARYEQGKADGTLPYQESWMGIFHNPQAAPPWAPIRFHLNEILALPEFQASLPHCKGLFALSRYHASYLTEKTGLPVGVLYHPTDLAVPTFNMEAFLRNPIKKVVQIGTWLRKLNAIYALPLEKGLFRKIQLVPDGKDFEIFNRIRIEELAREKLHIADKYYENTFAISYLDAAGYDDLLGKNIAFLDLYDASANNAVIECIARATPLLINRIPATEEYLGKAYPLFYDSWDQAADMANDFDLIEAAHVYLTDDAIREKLSADHFLKSFKESDIYQDVLQKAK